MSGTVTLPSGTRDPSLWPFSVTSPWNMPIGSGAQFAGVNDVRNSELRSAGAWVKRSCLVASDVSGAGV